MMTPIYQNVAALVADSSQPLVAETEAALKEIGVQTAWRAASLTEIRERLAEMPFDLFIAGTAWAEGDLCEVISAVRHGHTGDNPFLGIVVVAPDLDSIAAKRAVRSGADTMIVRPVSADIVRAALEFLTASRNPFVVTSDYVGPDRRAGSGRESAIPLIDVPNTMRDKTKGTYDAESTLRAIGGLMVEINIQKLQRHAEKVSLLVKRIGPDMMVTGVDESVRAFLDELIFVAEDISRRVRGTALDPLSASCGHLVTAAEAVHKRDGVPPAKEFDRLLNAAEAVRRGFISAVARV